MDEWQVKNKPFAYRCLSQKWSLNLKVFLNLSFFNIPQRTYIHFSSKSNKTLLQRNVSSLLPYCFTFVKNAVIKPPYCKFILVCKDTFECRQGVKGKWQLWQDSEHCGNLLCAEVDSVDLEFGCII